MADDPTKVTVQINVRMPWFYHQHLKTLATEQGTSVSALVNSACQKAYGKGLRKQETHEAQA